jgi:hypothetical protein
MDKHGINWTVEGIVLYSIRTEYKGGHVIDS